MCNLYKARSSAEEMARLFGAHLDPADQIAVEKDYVAPGKPGHVVREQGNQRILSAMNWGFPFQGKPVTNVRNYTSPFWKSALANPSRRCLVPVTEF